MPTVKENLIAAKALIDTPEKWGKGADSFPMSAPDGATCLCAHGAIYKALKGEWGVRAGGPVAALFEALPEDAPFRNTPDFNDHPDTTHADIMALFDRAIAAQED